MSSSKEQTNRHKSAIRSVVPAAERLGVRVSDEQCEKLALYCTLLEDYNSHTNLVSSGALSRLAEDHVLDALALVPPLATLAEAGNERFSSLVDVGSGAGFPAMVLAIMCDFLEVTMVDSVQKKVRFLESAGQELGLEHRTRALAERAEDLGQSSEFREQFAFATARAVGVLELVCELTIPLLKPGGYLLAQKSQKQLLDELRPGEIAVELLGAQVSEVKQLPADLLQREHSLVIIRKKTPTPRQFPRSASRYTKLPISQLRNS